MRWKPVLTPLPNSVPEVVKTVVLVTAGAAVFPAGPLNARGPGRRAVWLSAPGSGEDQQAAPGQIGRAEQRGHVDVAVAGCWGADLFGLLAVPDPQRRAGRRAAVGGRERL